MALFERLLNRAIFDPPMERALFNVFMLIFFLTALVTLAGIANLVTIDSSFLNKLYFALIAEVAGGVTTLFGITFLNTSRQQKNLETTSDIALDEAVRGEDRSIQVRRLSVEVIPKETTDVFLNPIGGLYEINSLVTIDIVPKEGWRTRDIRGGPVFDVPEEKNKALLSMCTFGQLWLRQSFRAALATS